MAGELQEIWAREQKTSENIERKRKYDIKLCHEGEEDEFLSGKA